MDLSFFPFEISLFVLGMLGHRLYARGDFQRLADRVSVQGPLSYIVAAAVLLGCMYAHMRGILALSPVITHQAASLLSYLPWVLFLPVVFSIFRESRIDRFLGELSYPVYLIHYLVLVLLGQVLAGSGLEAFSAKFTAIVSVGVSIVLYLWVIRPIDRYRLRYIKAVE